MATINPKNIDSVQTNISANTIILAFEDSNSVIVRRKTDFTDAKAWLSDVTIASGTLPKLLFIETVPKKVYLFYLGTDSKINYRTSTDDGSTWSTSTVINQITTAYDIELFPNGNIYVVYASNLGSNINHRNSLDSFATETTGPSGLATSVAISSSKRASSDIKSRVVMVYTEGNKIKSRYTDNNGTSWSAAIEITSGVRVDLLYLSTGHLLLSVDKGYRTIGYISRDDGLKFDDALLIKQNASYPSILETTKTKRDLYLIYEQLNVKDNINVIKSSFINLFTYLSEVIDITNIPSYGKVRFRKLGEGYKLGTGLKLGETTTVADTVTTGTGLMDWFYYLPDSEYTPNTLVKFDVRFGNAVPPNSSWTNYISVNNNSEITGGTQGNFLQHRFYIVLSQSKSKGKDKLDIDFVYKAATLKVLSSTIRNKKLAIDKPG